MTPKQVKQEFRKKAEKNPDKYYATNVLRGEGFTRKQCECGVFYWTAVDKETCDDPQCSGGFRFFDDPPVKKKYDYIQLWKKFSSTFKRLGYEPIKRYPVAARWRKDTDFVQASIYDFQPYVVSGEVDPPANPLVVPQLCLRFNDIDNVGITGAHYTCFVMIGQHAFVPPEDWNQEKYFSDIHYWLTKGLGLPEKEITYHEDTWAGGGNFGPSMEFFSRGLELGNQVYMMYEQTPEGAKELKLKVLDMGMGHERNSWFSQGKSTSYETTFPSVVKKLCKTTGLKTSPLLKNFLPYSSYLNVDEIESADKAWDFVAKKLNTTAKELRSTVIPMSHLYSVAEHSRSLLVALSDGTLPSDVGGGYNLRVLYRRAMSFIDEHKWNVEFFDLCEEHARYLKPIFPELSENLEDVKNILESEKRKYKEAKRRGYSIVERELSKGMSEEKLYVLYESHGVRPEQVSEIAEKLGKKVKIPDNFYARLAERREKQRQETQTGQEEKIDFGSVTATKALYFGDWSKTEFNAKVVAVKGNFVVLNQTLFYPTSGGQIHDIGSLNNSKVVEVFKQGSLIVHKLEKNNLKKRDKVKGKINFERRKQLAQHHTATHILNGAAKKVLGNHVWQAGAAKLLHKARLDITHYENLTEKQVRDIEKLANETVKKKIKIKKYFLPRQEAEKKFGFSIYQGGAVPGKELRIVEIPGFDTEACGGTHLNNTEEAGNIKIIKTSKVQDGIIRLEFVAGSALKNKEKEKSSIIEEAAELLGCSPSQVPGRAEELFWKWKQKVKKKKEINPKLESTEEYKGDLLKKTAEILKTQPEHITKTITRFLREL